MKAGPVRSYAAPSYATREQALVEPHTQESARPRKLFRHPLGWSLGLMVAAGSACAFGCIAMCPTVYMSEAEALEIIQDQFALYGIQFDTTGREGPAGLPYSPDLANWSLGIIVDYVGSDQCSAQEAVARDLLDQGDAYCGFADPDDTDDTGEPDDTGMLDDTGLLDDTGMLDDTATPWDTGASDDTADTADTADTGDDGLSGWREDLEERCVDFIVHNDCGRWGYGGDFTACIEYACLDLHSLIVFDMECEGETEWYLQREVDLFVAQLQQEGVL